LPHALEPEAGAPDERDRGHVVGPDVRFDAMQPARDERVSQRQLQRLRHVSLTRVVATDPVAEMRVQKNALHDVVQAHGADDRAIRGAANQQLVVQVAGVLLEQAPESLGAVLLQAGGRLRLPRPQEIRARANEREELLLVRGMRSGEEHAGAGLHNLHAPTVPARGRGCTPARVDF
jgi:hypothetical protein